MRIIIGTNVLVSAVLRDRDPETVIQFIVDAPEFEWVVSQDILNEYKAVLSRPKFCLTPAIQEQ
jgi:predicted nucleic acid-binding protein